MRFEKRNLIIFSLPVLSQIRLRTNGLSWGW